MHPRMSRGNRALARGHGSSTGLRPDIECSESRGQDVAETRRRSLGGPPVSAARAPEDERIREGEWASPYDGSNLSVAAIASAMPEPGRLVGMHFFNPVHAMRLVEVVTHPRADRGAIERAVAFARALGREPIVVQDSPGFASSRLGVVLGLEAMRMLKQGAARPQDIDKAMGGLQPPHGAAQAERPRGLRCASRDRGVSVVRSPQPRTLHGPQAIDRTVIPR